MRGSGRPVWDDETAPEDLSVLDPDLPDELPSGPDVLVIGGGIAGLAIAASCTTRGMDVALIERDRLAGGASGRAAGGLAPDAHPDAGPDWHAFARRSLELHHELDARWHYGLETVDLRVVPDIVIPNQARVNPLCMAAAFARNAGRLLAGVEVLSWDDRSVLTTAGEVRPAAVVLATGSGDAAASFVKGHVLATEPAPFELKEIVATIDADFLCLQSSSKRIIAGGTKEPDDLSEQVVASTIARITDKLSELMPQSETLEITHSWSCFRPCASDQLPIVDRIGDRTWIVAGLYSTGILMAPAIGEAIASWIEGSKPDGIDAFASGRDTLEAR